jgi:hypothetical protein
VKVLYVLASARSGNTVLGRVLGGYDGFFQAGEIRFLWERALDGRRCGCGALVSGCEVWGTVLNDLARSGIRADDVVRWQRQATRLHHTRRIARQRPGRPSGNAPLGRYVEAVRGVYRSLARVTEARVIVDTSQRPSNGAALRLLPDVDAYFLHLVRDPRGFVLSRRRAKRNPDRDVAGVMQGKSLARDLVYWSATNVAAELVCRAVPDPRRRRLRYEDLVARPRRTAEDLVRFVGEPVEGSPFVDERSAVLGTNHIVSGNPDRFTTGTIEIRLDDRWVREMATRDRWLVTSGTLPLMLRYGYPVRSPQRSAEER